MYKLSMDMSRSDARAHLPRRRDTAVIALQHVIDILILLRPYRSANFLFRAYL